MRNEWYNNLIGKKLFEEYPHDFSVCDIDGAVRCRYGDQTRLIFYESKNAGERISRTQIETLRVIESNINWHAFDYMSGVYILRIIDIDSIIEWRNLDNQLVHVTNFDQLYAIFSAKDARTKQ